MRLSDAMLMGRNLCSMEAGNWNSCALGVAGTAVGVPRARVVVLHSDNPGIRPSLRILYLMEDESTRGEAIRAKFPWIKDVVGPHSYQRAIFERFDDAVCCGRMTFEQLVDYVRSVEPDCETCCKFECSCPVEEPVRKVDKSVEVMA